MKLICANFKMNLLEKDILDYLDTIDGKILKENVIFFPNNLYIKHFYQKNYLVGSQNISFQNWGAITGDTSILQLKELGISYTLIGHSERREYFNDSKFISKKVNLALENNIKVILCIGENKNEWENNQTFEVLKKELDEAIKMNLNLINFDNFIVAYEPIWAIGTGNIPSNPILEKTILEIKEYLRDTYHLNINVLYGGSVNLENILKLEKIKNIDGYLVGGLSLHPNQFLSLINKVK